MKNEELRLQAKCFKFLNNYLPNFRGRFFAINNNSQNEIKGSINKAIGVFAGVADSCLLLENGRCIWIEFKTTTGRQRPEQEKWQKQIEDLGHQYLIIRNFTQFYELILEMPS